LSLMKVTQVGGDKSYADKFVDKLLFLRRSAGSYRV